MRKERNYIRKVGCKDGDGGYKKQKMIKTIKATYKLRGTEQEIGRIKARIATLSACEECVSLYIEEKEET